MGQCFCRKIDNAVVSQRREYKSYCSAIIAMLLGAVAVMNSATYFPEFVKARTAACFLFAMINRKPKTGDIFEGDRVVRSNPALKYGFTFSTVT